LLKNSVSSNGKLQQPRLISTRPGEALPNFFQLTHSTHLLKTKIMKKLILCGLIALSTIAVTFTSCKKYEDGPSISLLSKKSRLCGHWTLESYTTNDSDITTTVDSLYGAGWELQIEKDDSYKSTGDINQSGKWAFGEDKDDVIFTPDSSSMAVDTFRILQLKSKSLWLRSTNPQGTYDVMKLNQ
jgi:hypothetical protein